MGLSTKTTAAGRDGVRAAGEVCRRWLPQVYFASRFLPRPRRSVMYAMVAVARQLVQIIDPIARDHGGNKVADDQSGCGCDESPQQRRSVCLAVMDHLESGKPTGKPELDVWHSVTEGLRIPPGLWTPFTDGLIRLHGTLRYATWSRLRSDLQPIADAIARLLTHGLDRHDHEESDRKLDKGAAPLVMGMHWAMMLCDATTHWERGRLIIPLDDLTRFGLCEADVSRRIDAGRRGHDEQWVKLLRYESDRGRHLIRGGWRSLAGWLDPSAKRAGAALVAQYEGLLNRLENLDPLVQKLHFTPWSGLRQIPAAIRIAVRS